MQGRRGTASAERERDRGLICVVGSLNVDLVSYASRIPNAGETLSSESFTTGWGGKGANQAVATARLASSSSIASDAERSTTKIRVKMIGAVGADSFGPDLKAAMEAQGVDTSDVRVVNGQPTGVAVILVETSSGENRILVNAGANATVLPATLPQSLFNDSSSPPSLIIIQLETPLETVLYVCKEAKKQSIPVLLNPAPAIALPDSVYPDLELLVVNETEASILSGIALPPNSDEDTVISFAYAAGKWFNDRGCSAVIVTLGALGAVVRAIRTDGIADSYMVHTKAVPAEVVDTTAAGDTFIGAVAVSLVRHWASGVVEDSRGADSEALSDAVSHAVRASAWTVARKGTWDAMPRAEDVYL